MKTSTPTFSAVNEQLRKMNLDKRQNVLAAIARNLAYHVDTYEETGTASSSTTALRLKRELKRTLDEL